MMNAWELPTYLTVGGELWNIRTDYRAILDILENFSDPEYEPDEQWEICLDILYVDYEKMPHSFKNEAMERAKEFIDAGIKDDGKQKARLMDWTKDAPLIAAPISTILGRDVRSPEPLHWWTFLSAYLDIRESLYADVLNIRSKKARGKRLEKYEQEFYQGNKSLIDLPIKRAERSKEETEELRALFGFKK